MKPVLRRGSTETGSHFTCFTSTEVQILTAGVYRLCLDISDDSVHDSLDMSRTRAIALESPSKLSLSKSEKEEFLAQAEEQRAFLLRRWSGFFNLTCFTGTKVQILTHKTSKPSSQSKDRQRAQDNLEVVQSFLAHVSIRQHTSEYSL